jgi:TolB protein
MRLLLGWLLTAVFLFGADATIEVIKKVDSYPSIAVEDSSISFTDMASKRFFRLLVSDLNVLSLFNVDRHYATINYDNESVERQNRVMDYVLRYRLRSDDSGSFIVDIKLIRENKAVMQKSYRVSNVRMNPFVAHTIAYDINAYFGAEPVEWMKRKVIISRLSGPHESEIVIADYTLSYQHVMIKGGLNVFPKWADSGYKSFYYTSLSGDLPTLIKIDTRTGKKTKLLSSDGMLVCSDVSSDGKKLILTMAPAGQPDIYVYDVETGKYRRLTTFNGIDVNGQFMDDGRIVFVSNRLGYPNVFAKRLGSKSVEQMVYYGKSNSACTAHKEYIVYKARESSHAFSKNTFNLHLISVKTDFIRRLTATGVNEFPRFSRDGNAIIYVKNYKQQSSIGIMRLRENKNFLFPLKSGKIQSMDW